MIILSGEVPELAQPPGGVPRQPFGLQRSAVSRAEAAKSCPPARSCACSPPGCSQALPVGCPGGADPWSVRKSQQYLLPVAGSSPGARYRRDRLRSLRTTRLEAEASLLPQQEAIAGAVLVAPQVMIVVTTPAEPVAYPAV